MALLAGVAASVGCAPPAGDDTARASAAITHGELDSAHPAVVALWSEAGSYCTGVLVSPRVVLTAGHCLLHNAPESVLFHLADEVRSTEVLDFRRALSFDWDTLDGDIGVLLLQDPAPAGVEPVVLQNSDLGESFVGETVSVVGFGRTEESGSSLGTRRFGTSTVSRLQPDRFLLGPDPSLMCDGDSGGAVLLEQGGVETLVGVGSSGDADCEDHTAVTRVDVHVASLIRPYVEATDTGAAGIGDRCFHAESCREGWCAVGDEPGAFSYCTQWCAAAPCPEGMSCGGEGPLAGTCRHPHPEPGALNSPCETNHGCSSDVCARPSINAPWRCSERCFPTNATPCPSPYVCLANPDSPTRSACFVPEESPPLLAEHDSGCSVAPSGASRGSAWALWALATLWVAWRGYERRRAEHGPGGVHALPCGRVPCSGGAGAIPAALAPNSRSDDEA